MSLKTKKVLLFGLLFLAIVLCGFLGYSMFPYVQMHYVIAVVWIVTVIVLLWYGNKQLFSLMDARLPWLSNTSTRFFVQLFLSCVYSLLVINITYYLFKIQTSSISPDPSQFLVLNVYGLLFLIPVLSVNFSLYFAMQWKAANLISDRLREENLRTQLNSLRMQLDPHFLFNNLNVLSALIESSPPSAQDFLDKFADVYRYVLQYKNEELVPLEVELEFIHAYTHLLGQRFGSQLTINIGLENIPRETYFIPPLSLQLLIENALKHNSIAGEHPFLLAVEQKGDWLTVRNTYRPKAVEQRNTESTGLDSIRRRYEVLSDRNIKIHQDESFFIVSLPLLEILD